jgi:hypothetical protein
MRAVSPKCDLGSFQKPTPACRRCHGALSRIISSEIELTFTLGVCFCEVMQQRKSVKKGTKTRRLGPSEVGRMAGITKQAASRRLRRGESPEQIVSAAENRRARLARISSTNGSGNYAGWINGVAGEGDGVGVNGGGGSYADAARAKLAAQASREQLKLERERGALVPETFVQTLIVAPLLWFMQERRSLPARLRDDLHMRPGAECEEILSRELGHYQQEFARRLRLSLEEAESLFAEYWEFVHWRKARAEDAARHDRNGNA